MVALGDGRGGFAAPYRQDNGLQGDPSNAVIRDWNGDGRPDVVLFGGSSTMAVYNDTWEWDGNTWTASLPLSPERTRGVYWDFQGPFGVMGATAQFALVLRRYLHQFPDVAFEQIGKIAVSTRYNAGFHPGAIYRKPFTLDEYLGSRNVVIRRNVFLNWQGSSGSNFVLFGEDGTANHEAFDGLVENNLMLGNSANTMRAAFGVKGSRDIVFRANTVVGNLPSLAFAMRLNREGSNPVVSAISFHNNLWSDPTGTMEDFSDTPPADSQSITLRHNGYWNGGNALPTDAGEAVTISDDTEPFIGDPALPAQTSVNTPVWNPTLAQFDGGFSTIRETFIALVEAYGQPATNGIGIDQADPANMPADDILGRARDAVPDLGAFEKLGDVIFADGFEM